MSVVHQHLVLRIPSVNSWQKWSKWDVGSGALASQVINTSGISSNPSSARPNPSTSKMHYPNSKVLWNTLRKLSLSQPYVCTFSPDTLNSHFTFLPNLYPAKLTFTSHCLLILITFSSSISSLTIFWSQFLVPTLVIMILITFLLSLSVCLPGVLPVLFHIYNSFLLGSVFPSTWKSAHYPIPITLLP